MKTQCIPGKVQGHLYSPGTYPLITPDPRTHLYFPGKIVATGRIEPGVMLPKQVGPGENDYGTFGKAVVAREVAGNRDEKKEAKEE
jgi:hypothetical protein